MKKLNLASLNKNRVSKEKLIKIKGGEEPGCGKECRAFCNPKVDGNKSAHKTTSAG